MSADEHVLVIADVHANDAALQAVLAHASRRYLDHRPLKVWFLGDLFGRGPAAANALDRLHRADLETCVAGNHDWGVIGKSTPLAVGEYWEGDFRPGEWRIILAHREDLVLRGLLECDAEGRPRAGEVYERVANWPLVATPRTGVYLVHGGALALPDPEDLKTGGNPMTSVFLWRYLWAYITGDNAARVEYTFALLRALAARPDSLAVGLFQSAGTPALPSLAIVGHYHRRILHIGGPDGGQWERPVELERVYALDPTPDAPVLFSPGSVGFARENRPDRDASYAVLCLHEGRPRELTFHRVTYGRGSVIEQMRELWYPDEVIGYLREAE